MKIKNEEDMAKAIISSFIRGRLYKCRPAVREFQLQKCKFDVVGYNSNEKAFYLVECKAGRKATDIGHAFGQILAYKSVLSDKGYDFLKQFNEKSRVRFEDIIEAVQEKKLRVKFFVALRQNACKNFQLLRLMKQSLPDVGIIRVRDDGACRPYIRVEGNRKDYEICNSQLMSIPVRRIYERREFFDYLSSKLRDELAGSGLENFRTYMQVGGPFGNYEQFYYEKKALHFEVWFRKMIEVGLHSEATKKSTNQKILNFFKSKMKEIQENLGENITINPAWGRKREGWGKVYEEIPKTELNEELLEKVTARLAAYIRTLKPLIDDFHAAKLR